MIAEQQIAFSPEHLQTLLDEITNIEAIENVKNYIEEYFIRSAFPSEVLMWCPDECMLRHLSKGDAAADYLAVEKISFRFPNMKHDETFDLQKWFFSNQVTLYKVGCDFQKPRTYKIKGQNYINMSSGYLYTNPRSFTDFNIDVKNAVDIIFNHIKEVWCSNIDEQYIYIKTWIALMVSGRKIKSLPYLRSGQGTGKSCMLEFIQENVLGSQLTIITQDPDSIAGFNDHLSGKALVILEDVPVNTKEEWKCLYARLKQLVTGSKIEINEKHKSRTQLPNSASFLVISNKNALCIENDDRRVCMLDISDKYVGNTKYFNRLHTAMNVPDVGEAFFAKCLEIAAVNQKFDEMEIPKTTAKQTQVLDSLDHLWLYIKCEYLKYGSGIEEPCSQFYKNYARTRNNPHTIREVGKMLKSTLGLESQQKKVQRQNCRMYIMSFAEIYNKLDKKRWIDEWDEIEPSENEKEDIEPELFDIQQPEDPQEEPKPELSDIQQPEDPQEEPKPELSDIEQSEESLEEPKPELSDIKQSEDLQEESEPELSDIEQSEEPQEELKPELSDIKQSEKPEETLEEFLASLFPDSFLEPKKESEFEPEIDFEELDALLA